MLSLPKHLAEGVVASFSTGTSGRSPKGKPQGMPNKHVQRIANERAMRDVV